MHTFVYTESLSVSHSLSVPVHYVLSLSLSLSLLLSVLFSRHVLYHATHSMHITAMHTLPLSFPLSPSLLEPPGWFETETKRK